MSSQLQYLPDYLKAEPKAINDSLRFFYFELASLHVQRVLEVGTRRWFNRPTHHKALFPQADRYVMCDCSPGEDVDVICDVHYLTSTFNYGEFNVFWASSVWEHLKEPWTAAQCVLDILAPGGLFFIQTHLCFPEHGFPDDYFRFTRAALEYIFRKAKKVVSCYDYPADLIPREEIIDWNKEAPNFLNTCIAGRK